MKTNVLWSQQIEKPKDPNSTLTNQVMACCFISDGSVLVAAVGDALLVYNAATSDMLRAPIRGYHNNSTIYTLACSKDGQRVASGGSDKTVIVWSFNQGKFEPENKFGQADTIYTVSFSPLKSQIFSGSGQDYVLYVPGEKQIDRIKFKDKIICSSWSGDGQLVAFGTVAGSVVLCDRAGAQIREVPIQKNGPVWCMEWTPVTSEHQSSILTVGAWSNTLVTLDQNGLPLGSRVELPMDPLWINYAHTGEYMVIGGNNNKVQLYSREGAFLSDACEAQDWVWSAKLKPKSTTLAYTTNDGTISVCELVQGSIHAFYQDKFITRENLTDVLILQMITGQKARIKCKELVKKVGIFKEKVAVLCGIKVIIYNCIIKSEEIMKYKLFKKFTKRIDCDHFQVVSSNVLVASGLKLIAYNFNGDMDRAWTFDSPITVLVQCGGPPKREMLLVGTENGSAYKVFLDNSFPVLAFKTTQPIRKLCMSATKRKLALIDSNQSLFVIDMITKENLFGEMSVEGVAFNEDFEDLIAYSGKSLLFVKCIKFPALSQRISGNIVGFKSSKLFLLDGDSVQTLEIQQTQSMLKYIECKDFQNAFKIACLGVTEQDFRHLGTEALIAGEFDIARRCFVRNKDYLYIDLLEKYEKMESGPTTLNLLNAEALAYQQKYADAGNLLLKAGLADSAIQLFMELKKWDDAKNVYRKIDIQREPTASAKPNSRAGTAMRIGTGVSRLSNAVQPSTADFQPPQIQMKLIIKMQAEWTKETGDWKTAAELFVQCGEFRKAIDLYGQNKCMEPLLEICRMITKADNAANLQLCAQYFKKNKHHGGAKEAYLKLDDQRNLMLLHIEFEAWQDAFLIGRNNPELLELAKVPYADYLLKQDRYEEALRAYKSAGRYDISIKMTKEMARNCLDERRYRDASLYIWNTSVDCIMQVKDARNPKGDDFAAMQRFHEHSDLAEVYFAYQRIHDFIEEPFQPLSGEAYFLQIMNAARFILSKWQSSFSGVKMSYVYYALAKTSFNLECYQTAKECYQKIHSYKVPAEWSEEVDLNSLIVRSKPQKDLEELVPLCPKCLTQNPITATTAYCITCKAPILASQLSYLVLPLVEFKVEGMSRGEIEAILNRERIDQLPSQKAFSNRVTESIQQQHATSEYLPVELDQKTLMTLQPEEVLIWDLSHYCPTLEPRYFKNMAPENPIHCCGDCGKFFFIDEHEFEYVQKRECPFCRTPDKKVAQKDVFDL